MDNYTIPSQTCWECRHFRIDYEGAYSEVTPGAGATIICYKNHYNLSNSDITQEEFAKAMVMGFTCKDFER